MMHIMNMTMITIHILRSTVRLCMSLGTRAIWLMLMTSISVVVKVMVAE